MKKYIALFTIFFALVFSGCGGGSSNSSTNDNVGTKTVSGYVEDDLIPNANIKVYDENGTIISTAKTDVNGKFALSGKFKDNSIYTFKSSGELNDTNITMDSIIKYTGDSIVNINPLDELKYQLVQSGKTIEEAEKLVRNYFLIINGNKLEQNRFDPSSSIALGMNELAKINGGKLPIDAIAKIKNDILTNADSNTTNYSYRSLMQNKITLNVSSPSVKIGEYVTINIKGVDKLNKNYKIKWVGISNTSDNNTSFDNNLSVKFTSDYPQDMFISAMLYKVDGNKSVLLSTASTKVNFYKEVTEQNLTIQNASVDNNITIGENSIIIPAGAVSENKVIKVKQYETGSDNTVAKFEMDTSGESDKNLTFKYKYDPYIVSDPRKLLVSITDGNDIKQLPVKNIDYNNHIVEFEIPLSNNVERGVFSPEIIRIDMVKSTPSKRKIYVFITKYQEYIKTLLKEMLKENDGQKAFDYLYNNKIGQAKFIKTLMETDKFGEYNYNILANVINQMIAIKNAEELSFYSESDWREYTYRYLCSEKQFCNYREKKDYYKPIRKITQTIAPWVGAVKATDDQLSFVNNIKLGVNLALTASEVVAAVAAGGVEGITAGSVAAAVGMAGTVTDYAWPSDMGSNAAGYAWTTITTVAREGVKFTSLANGLVTNALVGTAANVFTAYYEEENIKKGAPIFLALGIDNNWQKLGGEFLSYTDDSQAKAYTIDEFKQDFFPKPSTTENDIDKFYNYSLSDINASINNCQNNNSNCKIKSYFGKLDPTGILAQTFLDPYGATFENGIELSKMRSNMTQDDRKLLYEIIRYAYGDPKAKEFVKKMIQINKLAAYKVLLRALLIKKNDIFVKAPDDLVYVGVGTTIDTPYTPIKSKYDITIFDKLLVTIGYTRSLRSNTHPVSIYNLPNYVSFEKVMQTAKLKLTDSQKEEIHIKKIIMDTYGVGLNFSNTDNLWTIDKSNIVHHIYKATENINDKFVYDSELNKNVLSFDKLFEGEDFNQFDNKIVGFKITMVVEINGVEKIVSKNFVLTTVSNTQHTMQTDFKGATIKSSIKDAVTGDPIVNAQVTLLPGGLTDYTDENGSYTVNNLAAGNYTIAISKPGYVPIKAKIALNVDETKVFEGSMAIDNEHANTIGGADIVLKDALNGNVIKNGYLKIREGQNNKTGEVIKTIENNTSANSIHIDVAPGAYTLEIGANGYEKAFNTITSVGDTNQTYEFSITPVLPENQVRMVLTWGETPSDLDSHLVRLDSNGSIDYHVYYGNMKPINADASLDTDDTSSYGPETITINNLDKNKTYKYYVHDYTNRSDYNDTALKNSNAKVTVYYGDQAQTFYVPNEVGNAWKVFEIVNGEIVPCTNGCMFGVNGETDSQIGSRSIRRSNQNISLFKNLPNK